MGTASFVLFGILALAPSLRAQDPPSLAKVDRLRIAEAFRLADALGNRVWPEWDKAPFAILLVTPEREFLIGHPKPSADFTALGEDPILKRKVWARKRIFDTRLLATFPAVPGVASTIVVGQAENTEFKGSTRWVITLLHEHFHQLQNSQPDYFARSARLGLARGDQSGMWMLNYPFPYTEGPIKDQFSVLGKALAATLRARKLPEFPQRFADYVQARSKFKGMLKPDDDRYLSFQLWQEGIARYTEVKIAELAIEDQPSKEFQRLKDYQPYEKAARNILAGIEKDLDFAKLDQNKRTAFYSLGAAEGLVLDEAKPEWRKQYLQEMFSLDRYFAEKK